MALASPRLTTTEPPQPKPASTNKTVRFDSSTKIFRAGRLEATAGRRPADKREDRRYQDLIAANQNADEPDH